jgi:hypothetical protein
MFTYDSVVIDTDVFTYVIFVDLLDTIVYWSLPYIMTIVVFRHKVDKIVFGSKVDTVVFVRYN